MNCVNELRCQLRIHAEAWAAYTKVPFYRSLGKTPTILFHPLPDDSRHGNFLDSAWTAIRATPDWSKRLEKQHSQKKALPLDYREAAKELDSSNSSDALLMNCFCPPGAAARIASVLGVNMSETGPQFGYNPRLSLSDGSTDSTEIDMRLGDTLFEAKLTEATFTSRPKIHVCRYSELSTYFDIDRLPVNEDSFRGYQLIRNVLAAAKEKAKLIVLIDRRRTDLQSECQEVWNAIKDETLKLRCGVRYWQDIAAVCEPNQAKSLRLKYGL